MANCSEEDANLAELLESALADFNQPYSDQTSETKSSNHETVKLQQLQQEPPITEEWPVGNKVSAPSSGTTAAASDPNESAEKLAAELLGGLGGLYQSANDPVPDDNAAEFIARLESQISNIDSTMRNLLEPATGDDDDPNVSQMKEELRRLVENVDKTDVNSPEDLEDISKTMQATLRKLNEDVADAQGPQASASPDTNDPLAPFMEQMLSALLSREVLYVPLKGITEKYPSWIDENVTSLPPEKVATYRLQLSLMQDVCNEFEKATNSEPNTMKIFELVQKMQELGPPPEDLVGVGDDNSSLPPALAQGSASGCPTM